MKKIFLIIPISIIIGVIVLGSQSDQPNTNNEPVFHVTLASPELYENGVYSSTFDLENGEYYFRFVPNGDSPQNLTISLNGDDFAFSEDFKLNGTLHDTGISEYYTWDYDGQKSILIPTQKEIFIQINPNGNLKGSVSVDIIGN
ncbi:MAG: hypothetical protein GQ471_02020 [Nitrosopumilus sp.]|jgi:hypothetical protein|nr:hypothetical protein [Nitrosopumilus sp.]